MPPAPVTVTTVEAEDVEVYADYPGRVRGAREVEVRARVSGILERRLHQEGALVEAGEALFQIEADPYEIALKQAAAEGANARANLNQAKREWRRVSDLFAGNVMSERERDLALSNLELAEARMESAEALKASAQLNLDYTLVQAPITGRTGLEQLPEGSLVERGTLLATLVQQDPMHVRFSVPERDAAVSGARREGRYRNGNRQPARLRLPGGGFYERPGEVDFTASTIDPRTGTVSLRATFENPDGELISGQFVRVEMLVQSFQQVFRVDPSAVDQGPEGPRVFVVDSENIARSRTIQLGPVVDGKQVVLAGLEEGDRLVVNGQVALQDEVPVNPTDLNREGE